MWATMLKFRMNSGVNDAKSMSFREGREGEEEGEEEEEKRFSWKRKRLKELENS